MRDEIWGEKVKMDLSSLMIMLLMSTTLEDEEGDEEHHLFLSFYLYSLPT